MQSLKALVTLAAYQVCKRVWPMEVFQIMFLRFDSKSGHKIYELVFSCKNVYVTESPNLPSVIKYTWILVSSQQLLLRGNSANLWLTWFCWMLLTFSYFHCSLAANQRVLTEHLKWANPLGMARGESPGPCPPSCPQEIVNSRREWHSNHWVPTF